MNVIELERWKPSQDDPRKLEYAGQPTAEEVFQELKYRLEGMGYLPEEYFLLDPHWENGREIPRGADIFCTTDYGESEGVYLDVYLKWYEDGKPITKDFITSKTLGENGNDLDRMFLISSAITKAFHGDNTTHARYMKVGGVEEDMSGSVVYLSQREQRAIIEALVEQRERQEESMSQTEQLLRRMTGSITAYMDTVGQRPLRMSAYDKAALTIRDGELNALRELWPKVRDHADDLLLEIAARPGDVGQRMTALALSGDERYPRDVYREACRKAVDIGDQTKVEFLLRMADGHSEGVTETLHGEIAHYAYQSQKWIAGEIVGRLTQNQFNAAPYYLLTDAIVANDFNAASKLAQRGFNADSCFPGLVRHCSAHHDEWQITRLLAQGLHISPNSFDALHSCIEYNCPDAGKALLDKGMDLDEYEYWAKGQSHGLRENDTLKALEEHWQTIQAQAQEQEQEAEGPQMGVMSLG